MDALGPFPADRSDPNDLHLPLPFSDLLTTHPEPLQRNWEIQPHHILPLEPDPILQQRHEQPRDRRGRAVQRVCEWERLTVGAGIGFGTRTMADVQAAGLIICTVRGGCDLVERES